jgi:hypothetical protein
MSIAARTPKLLRARVERGRFLPREVEGMLQENCGGKCVDVAASCMLFTTHFANRPARNRRRKTFIDKTRWFPGSAGKLRREPARIRRERQIVPFAIEREGNHELDRVEFLGLCDQRRNRNFFPAPAFNDARRGRAYPELVADSEPEAFFPHINSQYPHHNLPLCPLPIAHCPLSPAFRHCPEKFLVRRRMRHVP